MPNKSMMLLLGTLEKWKNQRQELKVEKEKSSSLVVKLNQLDEFVLMIFFLPLLNLIFVVSMKSIMMMRMMSILFLYYYTLVPLIPRDFLCRLTVDPSKGFQEKKTLVFLRLLRKSTAGLI